MPRIPMQYAPRILKGWETRKNSRSNSGSIFDTAESAISNCDRLAGTELTWNKSSSTTPERHHWFIGTSNEPNADTWKVDPVYDDRTKIPAEAGRFINDDPACIIYIQPINELWGVYAEMDDNHTNRVQMNWLVDKFEMGGYILTLPHRNTLLSWEKTEGRAIAVARHFWSLLLLLESAPPLRYSKVNHRLRIYAMKFLLSI